jgi:nucleoid-associated protein YgaU
MDRDVKVGLVLGVLLVALVAVVFFRKEAPSPRTVTLTASSRDAEPAELPLIPTRPEPYHVSRTYLAPWSSVSPLSNTAGSEPPASASAPSSSTEPSSPSLTAPESTVVVPTPAGSNLELPPPSVKATADTPKPGGLYLTKPGDTLASIAERAYGDPALDVLIYEANADVLVSPHEVPAGLTLKLPSARSSSPVLATSARPNPSNARTPQASRTAPSEQRTYAVQPGESLLDVARRFYGDPSMYRVLLRANREVLSSPADVRPGMKLRIP